MEHLLQKLPSSLLPLESKQPSLLYLGTCGRPNVDAWAIRSNLLQLVIGTSLFQNQRFTEPVMADLFKHVRMHRAHQFDDLKPPVRITKPNLLQLCQLPSSSQVFHRDTHLRWDTVLAVEWHENSWCPASFKKMSRYRDAAASMKPSDHEAWERPRPIRPDHLAPQTRPQRAMPKRSVAQPPAPQPNLKGCRTLKRARGDWFQSRLQPTKMFKEMDIPETVEIRCDT